MYESTAAAEQVVASLARTAIGGGAALLEAIEALPAPIYVTDAQGVVTYFNSACIGFTGRTPTAGKDRWCVTWKLYTHDGRALPHDQCPMAEAIRQKRPIRGVMAVAERPDGARVAFLPLPTPILAADGVMAGAVNMLIDVTEFRQAADLRSQAARCRRLAGAILDDRATQGLRLMAGEYEAKANELEATSPWRDYVGV